MELEFSLGNHDVRVDALQVKRFHGGISEISLDRAKKVLEERGKESLGRFEDQLRGAWGERDFTYLNALPQLNEASTKDDIRSAMQLYICAAWLSSLFPIGDGDGSHSFVIWTQPADIALSIPRVLEGRSWSDIAQDYED